MAYWGKDDEPMYYTDGRPCNDSARRDPPPSWADQQVKEDYEALKYARKMYRQSRTGGEDV